MKISNWCKKLSAALVAAGALAPTASYAVNIPLGDPSFEAFAVPVPPGYAYANLYRPTSAWVDDLDAPPGYTQDDVTSNWLYNAAYAEQTTFGTKRASPRTGNQAMHGLFNYSAQETNAVFEAGRTYTFSLWAQNDVVLNEQNGVFMYIFDGTLPFSDANALKAQLFTAEIPARGAAMTAAESKANWAQISISHAVLPGAPEIGHAVGVGFFGRKDSALDDASLTSVIPEPGSVLLVGMGSLTVLGLRRRP
jgi:PEP-CTERM motif